MNGLYELEDWTSFTAKGGFGIYALSMDAPNLLYFGTKCPHSTQLIPYYFFERVSNNDTRVHVHSVLSKFLQLCDEFALWLFMFGTTKIHQRLNWLFDILTCSQN